MHEYLGVSKDVHSEPRTGSPANAKFATGEAHDGKLGGGDTIQGLDRVRGVYQKKRKSKGRVDHSYLSFTVIWTWRPEDDCCI